MNFSVYDVIVKVNLIEEIVDKIESDSPITEYTDHIRDLLWEYNDILKCAKVKI